MAAMLAAPNLGDLDEIHQTLVDLRERRDALDEQRCQSARTSRHEISEPAIREWISVKLAVLEDSLANPDATIPARILMAAFVDRIEFTKEGRRDTLDFTPPPPLPTSWEQKRPRRCWSVILAKATHPGIDGQKHS